MNDSNADRRSRIKQTECEKLILSVEDNGKFSRGALATLFTNALGEDPGVTGADLRFGSGAKPDVKALTFQAENWLQRTEWPRACR